MTLPSNANRSLDIGNNQKLLHNNLKTKTDVDTSEPPAKFGVGELESRVLLKGTIEEITKWFLIPKLDGTKIPVLDLSVLNLKVVKQKFKREFQRLEIR